MFVHEGKTPAGIAPVAKTATKDFLPQIAEAKGFDLVYDLNLENLSNDPLHYDIDNHAKGGKFDKIAYLLELSNANGSQYVFVSMDAFTDNLAKIGIPTAASGASFQQKVANMTVVSNANGVVSGKGIATGNIEFWPNNYGQPNAANIPDASEKTYDFGDAMDTGTADGYGSMQVHNYGAKQTIFAINHWSAGGETADIGIGNASAENTDWTFANNAGSYDHKCLRVFVHFVK